MAVLHALLVAINRYPEPRHRLKGCVNDLRALKKHLEQHSDHKTSSIRFHILEDERATREKIIEGFRYFDAAQDGDLCLFFFAGHGSSCVAPDEFWHLEPHHRNESIVCYDSRESGGRDLIDKELSFLIWQATYRKDLHFLVITDCCHSGTVTRLQAETLYRRLEKRADQVKAVDYLGFEFYKKDREGQYSPPRGRYVHLAACRDDQLAREIDVGGKAHGAFTYSLLEALNGAGNLISYAELITRAHIKIRTKIFNQSPQIEAPEPLDKNLYFLSGMCNTNMDEYLVSYRPGKGWIVHAGALHGVCSREESRANVFQLVDGNLDLSIVEVFLDYTIVNGLEDFDRKRTMKVRLHNRDIFFPLAFSADSEEEGKIALKSILDNEKPSFIQFVDDHNQARYIIHARKNMFFLTTPYSDCPLFEKSQGYDSIFARQFLANLRTVQNWLHILHLTNPASQIQEEEIAITFLQTTEAGNYNDDAPTQHEDWRLPSEFSYRHDGVQWHCPAFQLSIKNTSYRSLWVSLLFLAENFSITNRLIPIQALQPGEGVWALDVFKGTSYRTIPIKMEIKANAPPPFSIEEYLKIIISTEEFSTDALNQDGLRRNGGFSANRSHGRSDDDLFRRHNWTVRDICIRICREQ